nr:MAK10-like protein [Tanacetum cinerariifolium]
MGDENPIRTLGDYSKPSHEGYMNTIELPVRNNVVPLRSDTIWLVQNGCSFHGLWSKDPNQHLKDFFKLVDSLELDGENRERTSGPHDTQYCMEDPEQSFVEYVSSLTDDARDLQCSTHVHGSINAVTIHSEKQRDSYDKKAKDNEKEEKNMLKNIHINPSRLRDPSISFIIKKVLNFNSFFESFGLVPQSSNTEVVCTKGDDGEVMRKNDDSSEGEPEKEGSTTTEGVGAEYFDIFLTRSELAYHKYLMCSPIPSIFLRNPLITEGCPSNLKIPCNIRRVHVEKSYIDPNSSLNIMTHMMYNWITKRKLDPRENSNRGVSNFTGRIKGMYVFVGNFTYVIDLIIVDDISSIINPRLSQVVLERPFIEISNLTHDPPEGVVRLTNKNDEVSYKMPHKIEQYNSLSNLEK